MSSRSLGPAGDDLLLAFCLAACDTSKTDASAFHAVDATYSVPSSRGRIHGTPLLSTSSSAATTWLAPPDRPRHSW